MQTETTIMLIWGFIQLPISIIVTWKISNWYHNKKSKSDVHFDDQKDKALEILILRTGSSFSQFKEEFEHIINKREIYEHDLVAFGTKNYDTIIKTIEHNYKNVWESSVYYHTYLTPEEYDHHASFFNLMLRFVRTLQVKKKLDRFNEDSDIAHALKNLNDDLKIIKSQRKEYDGVSHIISASLCMGRHNSLRMRGIKQYKAASPI